MSSKSNNTNFHHFHINFGLSKILFILYQNVVLIAIWPNYEVLGNKIFIVDL